LAFSKKHSQLKQAVTRMVQAVMSFLDETPDAGTRLAAIEMLRTVTEGKIFLEVERARVTKMLSDSKKARGDLKGAKDVLCELQVETFGSMSRREKVEFILEQVALCIECGDWTEAGILARKISTKYLSRKPVKKEEVEDEAEKEKQEAEKKTAHSEGADPATDDVTDLKLRYFEQQIVLAKHDSKYLDVCKHYREVLDTEAVGDDPSKLHPVSFVVKGASRRMGSCRLTHHRYFNASSISSFSRHTTTSSTTSYTGYSARAATRRCPWRRNSSSSSPSTS
jgi:26S proteasome regulatory subunit N5